MGHRDAPADRAAITDLVYRYARAVDRCDRPLGHSVWHAEGTADYGAAIFRGSGRGAIDMICASHAGLLHHQHLIGNLLIDLDGDRAGSEAYFHANLRAADGDAIRHMAVWGRYVDRWSYRGGRWGIDHRIALIDFDELRTVTPLGNPAHGTRDAADPSYAAMPGYAPEVAR